MNLRKATNYNIGLDIGTASVGWAVTDEDGNLYHFKNRPTWGSRLFPQAETAAKARVPRGQRRRYDRRRQRLDWLQEFFFDEMAKVDPEFFIRLRQARLLPEDREDGHSDYRWPLFNDSDFTESDYYAKFPTIYHLRKWLIETNEKADIRLVYLAFHNIVKTRGNFLHQDNESLSATNANMKSSIDRLADALSGWYDEHDLTCSIEDNAPKLQAALEDMSLSRTQKREETVALWGLSSEKEEKERAKQLSAAVLGYQTDFNKLFGIEVEKGKFALDKDDAVEEFLAQCPDDCLDLFQAIQAVYSSYILMGILKGANGETISSCKVLEYERYGQQLRTLKELVRQYNPKAYKAFFRGERYEAPYAEYYNVDKAEGYTKYNLKRSTPYADFKKEVEGLFAGTSAASDDRYQEMMRQFAEETFLRRLKTSDNGSIPYQLHLEEMDAIIKGQGKYYPFLTEEREKIESLVSFRIPYYVGPLTTKTAAVDAAGNARFAWSVRKEGKEDSAVHPWDWEEVIDRKASAQRFIERMTGTCTYLQGEPVLPRCSLLYEKFCVLNELNGASWSQDGDKWHRFSYDDRASILEDLFMQGGSVSYKKVEDYLKQNGRGNPRVRGGQGESKFESKLSSYGFFCKTLGVAELDAPTQKMVEEIILWSTLFEDRAMFEEKIVEKYGDVLTDEQVKAIRKKRFTGWGKLSEKFLCGIKAQTSEGPKSIMDVLEEGDAFGKHIGQALVLMQVLSHDNYGFREIIDTHNKEYLSKSGKVSVQDLPGSPAVRRGVNQALKIVREIVSIAGCPPANIFVEVTRDEDKKNKGKRTKQRYDNLIEALSALKEEGQEALQELRNNVTPEQLDERLTLYFMQNGKSLYSGKPLDIRRVMNGDDAYQVDHIIPQSFTKDDSFENKALVLSSENQRKTDELVIHPDIRRDMKSYWRTLLDARLIGEKKYNNLMRAQIDDERLKGFINRQLVETSQIVKFVQLMLKQEFPEARVQPIKAAMSSQLRHECGFVKCREANNYHHAHDALIACELGRFIQLRHPGAFEEPVSMSHVSRNFVRKQSEEYKRTHRMPGSASFFVQSFMTSGFDKVTGEIFKDKWDADAEIAKIRGFLNYKDCHISRMPEVTSGAFWDATIYSPKDNKKALQLPLKKGLDPKKYGSYSREQFAYFFMYEATKKGKTVVEFAPVPVSIAAAVERDHGALVEYAKGLATANGFVFERVLRKKIYKYQLIEIDGDRLYVTGQKEVRNANELSFSQAQTEVLKRVVENADVEDDELVKLFKDVVAKYSRQALRLGKQLGVGGLLAPFLDAGAAEKCQVLLELIYIANASKNMIDLTAAGGGKAVGCMRVTHAKELGHGGYAFIDQSVTGMFERRQKIEL